MCDASQRFQIEWDGGLATYPNTATGVTLDDCYSMCLDGTWPGCVGFSRYTQASHDYSYDAPNVSPDVPDYCWWTSERASFVTDDSSSNEDLYKLLDDCPATLASCANDSMLLCATTSGPGACESLTRASPTWLRPGMRVPS